MVASYLPKIFVIEDITPGLSSPEMLIRIISLLIFKGVLIFPKSNKKTGNYQILSCNYFCAKKATFKGRLLLVM
jgi:hypothetical protein